MTEPDRTCPHNDFSASVAVARLATDEEQLRRGEISQFAATVTVHCADCGAPFGFRGAIVGLDPNHPSASPDALEIRLPLISPVELEILGPLAAMAAGSGLPGYRVRLEDTS